MINENLTGRFVKTILKMKIYSMWKDKRQVNKKVL